MIKYCKDALVEGIHLCVSCIVLNLMTLYPRLLNCVGYGQYCVLLIIGETTRSQTRFYGMTGGHGPIYIWHRAPESLLGPSYSCAFARQCESWLRLVTKTKSFNGFIPVLHELNFGAPTLPTLSSRLLGDQR